jgi:hypothetical protein
MDTIYTKTSPKMELIFPNTNIKLKSLDYVSTTTFYEGVKWVAVHELDLLVEEQQYILEVAPSNGVASIYGTYPSSYTQAVKYAKKILASIS